MKCDYLKEIRENENVHYPEIEGCLDNPIGICENRDNLVVNENFCRRCKRIYYNCDCEGVIETISEDFLDTRAQCEQCKKIFSVQELKDHYKKNLDLENEYYEIMREELVVKSIDLK